MTASIQALRVSRGWTQAQLAQRAGISRQMLSSVEAGRHVPNVAAAIGLATALDTTVEALFGQPTGEARDLTGSPLAVGTPVSCARVGENVIAIPTSQTSGDAWRLSDAVVTEQGVDRLDGDGPAELLLAGCDPILGIVARLVERSGHQVLVAPTSTGRSLEALAAGRVHGVVVHARIGGLPTPPVPVRRWRLANWQVGLAARDAAPRLETVVDQGQAVVQRDPGAGAQKALDRSLSDLGADTPLPGPIANGHIDAARRVSHGVGAAGVVMEAAASAFDLAFTPLEEHEVELWLATEWLDLPAATSLLNVLHGKSLAAQVQLLPGYDQTQLGTEAM
jgi:DNA-binding XRE family transcriptional regulator